MNQKKHPVSPGKIFLMKKAFGGKPFFGFKGVKESFPFVACLGQFFRWGVLLARESPLTTQNFSIFFKTFFGGRVFWGRLKNTYYILPFLEFGNCFFFLLRKLTLFPMKKIESKGNNPGVAFFALKSPAKN